MGDRLVTMDMGRKVGELLNAFRGRSWVPVQHNVAWAECVSIQNMSLGPRPTSVVRTKWQHLDPSSRWQKQAWAEN